MTEIIEILDTFSPDAAEGPVQSPKERAESLIQFMDVDNSGGITFDEFIKVHTFSSVFIKKTPTFLVTNSRDILILIII